MNSKSQRSSEEKD
ncbi:hypothetical protein VULLAG_LOCUS17974 [Vulpes lagopus]